MKYAVKKIFLSFIFDFILWTYIYICIYKVIFQKFILSLDNVLWDGTLSCVGFGFVTSLILFFIPNFSLGKRMNGLVEDTTKLKIYKILGLFVFILTFIVSVIVIKVSVRDFFYPASLEGAWRIFSEIFKPEFSIFEQAIFASLETICLAFAATTFAVPVALILSFFCAKNLNFGKTSLVLSLILKIILNISRSIEPLIWAIIFIVWVGAGPFAGMLSLFVRTVASLAKHFSETIESLGFIKLPETQKIKVIPQITPKLLKPVLSLIIFRISINIRMATVIGLVGGGGIGTLLMQYQGLAKWNEVGLLMLVIAVVVWAVDFTSDRIRAVIK